MHLICALMLVRKRQQGHSSDGQRALLCELKYIYYRAAGDLLSLLCLQGRHG
jgi:hypothetical protein